MKKLKIWTVMVESGTYQKQINCIERNNTCVDSCR